MSKKTKMIWNVGLIAALLGLLFILEQIIPSSSMFFTVLKKGAIYALVAVYMNLLNGFTGLFPWDRQVLCSLEHMPMGF